MTLDTAARQLLDQLGAAGTPPIEDGDIDNARMMGHMLAMLDGEPEPVETAEDRELTLDGHAVAVRAYRSKTATNTPPIVAWFHAGGGVIGDLDTADRTCRRLANRTGAIVVSADYRRAPEHRFPAAIDDCWLVTRWLAEHAAELGGDPSRIAVGGDSMGGTFAAVVAQLAAASDINLRHQLLVYPFTDLTFGHPSVSEFADGYLVTESLIRWFADEYLGGADPRNPLASPLYATDVSGAAPATVVVAEYDPVRDEGVAYAKKLTEAGVPVELVHCDGMIHVFFALSGVIQQADESMATCAARLRAALA